MSIKKVCCLLLCLLLCIPAVSAQETPAQPIQTWYELDEENDILTIRLPLYDAENTSWNFRIDNESVIELLTCEVLGDEAEETQSAWVGSFKSFAAQSGSTCMQFTLTDAQGSVIESRLLFVEADENAALSVIGTEDSSFYYISEDGTQLCVALPSNPSTGFSWSHSFSDSEILCCKQEEYISDAYDTSIPLSGVGGTWTARFGGTGKKAGKVTLVLNYARPWESRLPIESHIIPLFVNEAGYLELLPPPKPIASGTYKGEDEYSHLKLTRNPDGSYSAEISLYRLTLQDDGIGSYQGENLVITATDAAGNPMIWNITEYEGILTAVVVMSTWELLPEDSMFFFK